MYGHRSTFPRHGVAIYASGTTPNSTSNQRTCERYLDILAHAYAHAHALTHPTDTPQTHRI